MSKIITITLFLLCLKLQAQTEFFKSDVYLTENQKQ